MAEKEDARRRLAFDELLRVQLVLVLRKKALERDAKGIRHDLSGSLVARFHEQLPFALTDDQRAVIAEIEHDLAGPHPMHRLLQGDVGSGKTVVAVSTLLAAVQGGHQGAFMAPTEVLAEQHAATVRRAPRRRDRAGAREPVPGPAPARRTAHQPHHRPGAARRRWPGWPTAPSTWSSAPTRSSRRASASPASARW